MKPKRDLAVEDVTGIFFDIKNQIHTLENQAEHARVRCSHRDREGRSVLHWVAAGKLYDREYWSCDACGGGQSVAPVEERARNILAEEASFYQYVDAIARLMTLDDVDVLIESLPEPFATEFVAHGIKHFLPPKEGKRERFTIGRPLPDEAFEAFREWNERQQ